MVELISENTYLTWDAGTFPVLQVLVSAIFWALFYSLTRVMLRNCSPEYCCRVVTFVHGLVVACSTFAIHFCIGPAPWEVFGAENKPVHNAVLLLTLGYFMFDFTWCCLMGTEGAPMLAHHVLSLFILSYSIFTHRSGAEVTAVSFGAEVTNPFLQFRWFLREHNQYETTVGHINDYIFVFAFAFWRFCPGSYLLYRATTSEQVDLIVKIGAVFLYLISMVFMHGVGKFFMRKYIWKMTKPTHKED